MKNNINILIDNYMSTNNIGLQYYYLLSIYNIDKSNTNILLLLLEYSMYLGSCIDTKKIINEIKYNLYEENIYYNYLLDKYNNIYKDNDYLEYIKNSINLDKQINKDCYIFIDNCNKKYVETLNPEYIYLLGQKLYYKGYYKQSFYYFDKYIKIGIISLREAYIYLFYISNNEKYLNKLYELIIHDNITDLKIIKEVLLNNKGKYINKEIICLLHNIFNELISNKQKKLTKTS